MVDILGGVAAVNVRLVQIPVDVSVTIPLYNEADNIPILHERVSTSLDRLGRSWELVLVNDGSTDGSTAILDQIAAKDTRVTVVHLRRNYGQTAAFMAGIDHACGGIIVPMDGDLQNDPNDIVRLLGKLDEGFDVVSGWRKDRKEVPSSATCPAALRTA